MKVVVGTVMYSGIHNDILDDFINAINIQNYEEFDVLIIDDGIEQNKLERIFKGINRKVIVEKTDNVGRIYLNRILLMLYAKEKGYEYLVFLDIDDSMQEERIQKYVEQFEDRYTIYYNDMYNMQGEKIFETLPEYIFIQDIYEGNFLGLSNSAVNLNNISIEFINNLKEGDTNIFDWYMFSRLLLDGHEGKLVKGAKSFYRIYDNNMAGICDGSITELNKEVMIKRKHYEMLLCYSPVYKKLYEKYKNIDVTKIETTQSKFWWGKIKLCGGKNNEI